MRTYFYRQEYEGCFLISAQEITAAIAPFIVLSIFSFKSSMLSMRLTFFRAGRAFLVGNILLFVVYTAQNRR
jgi:hypothetical protein